MLEAHVILKTCVSNIDAVIPKPVGRAVTATQRVAGGG